MVKRNKRAIAKYEWFFHTLQRGCIYFIIKVLHVFRIKKTCKFSFTGSTFKSNLLLLIENNRLYRNFFRYVFSKSGFHFHWGSFFIRIWHPTLALLIAMKSFSF
jgi:hypothetical protein